MKKPQVIILTLIALAMACSKEGGENRATFPKLRLVTDTGVDLLNPDNPESYDQNKMEVWTIQNDSKVSGKIEIWPREITAMDSSLFILGVDLFYRGSRYIGDTGNKEFFIRLTESDIDTITWVVGGTSRFNTWTSEVKYNGQTVELSELQDYYVIIKE